jgi:hypothetical protein
MRLRGSRVIGELALLTYVLPTAFLAIPFVHIMHKYGLTDQSVVGRRLSGRLRHTLCDPDSAPIW